MPLILALSLAHGADVLWLERPDDASRAAVLAAAGGTELDAIALRAAASDVTDADRDAWKALAAAIEAVRPYEQQLDGELLIMRDLQRPIDAVGLIRDESDRAALFAALAYQGFAVDRFFGDELASAADAADVRVDYSGSAIPSPWRDAAALEPDRKISAYDIAEAPQRVRYSSAQELVLEQLPASLIPGGLPAGAELVVDGRPTEPDATGSVKLPPGRHLVHIAHGEHVLQRWDLDLAPGAQQAVGLPLDDATWSAFVDGLTDGGTAPEALKAPLQASGEVWFARPGTRGPEVFAVGPSLAVRSVEVELPRSSDGGDAGGMGLQLGAVGGWTGGQDFYYQDPRATPDPTFATVNAGTVGASAGVELPVAMFRLAAGADLLVPLGEGKAALTGDSAMRLRPVPHVAFGLRQAQAAVGYVFPYHPAVGLRGSQHLVGPLEARWLGWFGLPGSASREGAADYTYRSLGMAAVGLGVRI